ncbi:MAG: SufD family Fe-S cluster assembly protein [Desulfurobacteriaceae bacterium]
MVIEKGLLDTVKEKFVKIGLPEELFTQKRFNLLVDRNKVITRYPAPGVRSEVIETPTGVKTRVYIELGTKLEEPVTICFGVAGKTNLLTNKSEIIVGEGADVKFQVFGATAEGIKLKHATKTKIIVEKNAKFEFVDIHYNGEDTFIELYTETEAFVGENAYFKSVFKQIKGRAGKVKVILKANVDKKGVAVFETKMIGKKDDEIRVEDIIYLNGEESRGISKSRIIAIDQTKAEFIGETYGNAPRCRGHIDCSEIIRGKDIVVKAIPIVVVNDETAKITHEAAIGSIDKKQLETLMAKGLSEDESVDVIIQGILK